VRPAHASAAPLKAAVRRLRTISPESAVIETGWQRKMTDINAKSHIPAFAACKPRNKSNFAVFCECWT
jgi:hypothetical protein